MKKLIFALIAGATVMAGAQAQQAAPRPYVGVGVATADHNYSLNGVNNVNSDGYKASGKLFGGVELNQTWGVEAGYTDFRSSDFSYTAPNGTAGRGESDGHSIYIAGKATAPVNEQINVFGKLGVSNNKRSVSTNTGVNISDRDTGVYAGVGAEYKLNQQVSLTAEYERYGKSKNFGAKADVWTVAAKYSF